jgi:superfamily I DNA/RNA helicase
MTLLVSPDDWHPRGIDDLEPNAWKALRHEGSCSVAAGPGSGKSEFLAQRASFLLETGVCPWPRRILAISFKRDAANNLAQRVRERCPPELAQRFTSLTFDAFTKGLVDRFYRAIPSSWRPSPVYDLGYLKSPEVSQLLTDARFAAPEPFRRAIAEIPASSFESQVVGQHRLDPEHTEASSAHEFAVHHYWRAQLQHDDNRSSSLTFIALNRLAELLVRSNDHLSRALCATYPFVFVDEFQDTTYAQYDFLRSVFGQGDTTVTAVGDNKQKIMTWAGARPDAFSRFANDFGAPSFPLYFNFRSSTGLVRIQHVVASALDARAVEAESQTEDQIDGDVAQVWVSESKPDEAAHLTRWLVEDMEARGASPRNYALLVRQKAALVEAELADALAEADIKIRNESLALGRTTLQDLLAEDLTRVALALLRLGAVPRDPEAWAIAAPAVQTLHVDDPEDERACYIADAALGRFVSRLRARMTDAPPERESAIAVGDLVFEFLDPESIARSYAAYRTGDALQIWFEAFVTHLIACAEPSDEWPQCVDGFEGVEQVPLMTVHKSKGLEFDTIVFIGLDDQAWWSYSPTNPEGLATFFVALSRAKQRAIFSFCRGRGERTKIADLYTLLTRAGVPEVEV